MAGGGLERRRGLAFAGAVVVLAAAGVYLTMIPPSGSGSRTNSEQSVSQNPSQGAAGTPAAAPAPSPGAFDVYAYLPLSRQELGTAADVARRFTESYGTFSYGEDPAGLAQRIAAFATTEFGGQIVRTLTDPGLVDQNRADEVVSRARARVTSIRDMTAATVTFVVASVRHITAKSGTKDQSEEYAVTVTKVGTDWQIYDLQPASAGQEGDTAAEGVDAADAAQAADAARETAGTGEGAGQETAGTGEGAGQGTADVGQGAGAGPGGSQEGEAAEGGAS
jgi:hypothetical protein